MAFNGQAIYQLRLRRNMSRADLAHAIRRVSGGEVKATERGVRGWEKNEYSPRGEAMPAIAAALGCDIVDLFEENGRASEDDEEEDAAVSIDAALRLVIRRMLREEREMVA